MEVKQQQNEEKHKTNSAGFWAFAIIVFSALAIGIAVILIKIKA